MSSLKTALVLIVRINVLVVILTLLTEPAVSTVVRFTFCCLNYTGLMHDFDPYSHHLYPFCSRPEAASDLISVVAVEEVVLGVKVKFGDSR